MTFLKPMDSSVGFMKAIFQGKQGSGKTYTAVELACGIYKAFSCTNPILCIDTEGGFRFHGSKINERTGHTPFGVTTRNLQDVLSACREAEHKGVEIIMIDSVTHLWQGVMKSYKLGLAERLHRDVDKIHLTVDDIGKIKDIWSPFADWFVQARTHVMICGREGNEWDMIEDERGNSRLTKTGTKVKAEGEFGYESDFAVEMDLIQDDHPMFGDAVEAGVVTKEATSVALATVIKDRWDILMGARCFNPTYEFFMPVVNRLRPKEAPPIDTDPGVVDLTDDGRAKWKADKAAAVDNLELILMQALPGATGKDKQAKLDLIDAAFRTLSWHDVKRLPLQDLREFIPPMRRACDIVRKNRDDLDVAISELKGAAIRILGPVEEKAEEPSEEPQMAAPWAGDSSEE